MKRNFRSRTILCLIPTLLATLLIVRAYLKDPDGYTGFRLGIDLRGGTILVYEVDQEQTKQTAGADQGGGRKVSMADALKQRIDPADLLGVVVRQLGDNRVEIILPYRSQAAGAGEGANAGEVEEIKERIRQVGSMEFRILANPVDDEKAILAAADYLRRGAENPDSEEGRALDAAARAGLPPPFPNKSPDDPDAYVVQAGGPSDGAIPVQYAWVELDKNLRKDLGISTTQPGQGRPDGNNRPLNLFPQFESHRGAHTLFPYEGNVYWSRESRNEKNPAESQQKKFDYFVLTRVSDKDRVPVGGDVSINAFVDQGKTGEPVIGFQFNSRGAEKFYQMTSRNRPTGDGPNPTSRHLGIILDGRLISSASINEAIRERGIIHGRFDRPYVERTVNLLRSGALPATLKPRPVSENTIGPTLGRDTIHSGLVSVGLAFAAVLAFMIVYYRFAGLVATVALLANLLLTVGFMVAVNATFTLPGLAGLVLMLGMAVDANVLIYERVREERDRGMNLATALRNGYDRALPTIIDTHLSSIFTAIVLYAVGNDQLKGFGVSLTVGLIISLFTSLFMTRLMFDFWQSKNWLTQLRMMRLFSRPSINFMRIRYPMFAVTGLLTVLGVAVFLARGQQGLNVDFVGGTAYSGRLTEPVEIGELRHMLSEERQHERLGVAAVAEQDPDAEGKNRNVYEITYQDPGSKQPEAKPVIVSLANTPEGGTKEEREATVRRRAAVLPDWSVEQIFSGQAAGDRSPLFTVRTTERERELVEAAISRLLRETLPDGRVVALAVNRVTEARPEGDGYLLTFEQPTTKSSVKTVFERWFQKQMTDQASASEAIDVIEMGEGQEGRYRQMRLKINRENPSIQELVKANRLEQVVHDAVADIGTKPQPERLETFDGTLASETRSRALYAIVASWVAILLYLWFRFGNWTFGAAAVICLIHDLCFTLGAIALCHYIHDTAFGQLLGLKDFKIDLPAVAALLTLVGYSVNDTIVVFDRIKEVRGKSQALTPQIINDSVNQTLSRTILAATTVFLVVLVLYMFGGEGLHLFAFVMVMGVIVGTYSSIYIASPLLLIFGEGRGRPAVGEVTPAPQTA